MECPKCKNQIKEVNVISKCWEKGYLRGNKIVDYGGVEEITDTIKIECPKCQKDITKFVRE